MHSTWILKPLVSSEFLFLQIDKTDKSCPTTKYDQFHPSSPRREQTSSAICQQLSGIPKIVNYHIQTVDKYNNNS